MGLVSCVSNTYSFYDQWGIIWIYVRILLTNGVARSLIGVEVLGNGDFGLYSNVQ
jgi:hypothetical protein